MSTIHLRQTTTATPEQFVAGLTDFGPGRSKLFPNRYTLTRQPNGTTDIDVVVVRAGKTFKGRML